MGVLLLTNDDLTKATNLGGNIDPQRYVNCVVDAQLLNLLPILGDELYEKIMADFSGGTLSGIYLTLYEDYIKRVVIHKSAEYYLAVGAFQVTNAGIIRVVPDGSESASTDDIGLMVKHQRDIAKLYERRMVKFLQKNKADIPEWTEDCQASGTNILGFYLPNNYIDDCPNYRRFYY